LISIPCGGYSLGLSENDSRVSMESLTPLRRGVIFMKDYLLDYYSNNYFKG
jgi:hypothetical protein